MQTDTIKETFPQLGPQLGQHAGNKGGPLMIYKDILLRVYPELEPLYKTFGERKCNCNTGPNYFDIWKTIHRLNKDGRDLSLLADLPIDFKHRVVQSNINAKYCGDERIPCRQCYMKHLSQAIILLGEVLQGYDGDEHLHKWLAIGHLAEAGDEISGIDVLRANNVRLIRLDIMASIDNKEMIQHNCNQLKKIIQFEESDTVPDILE
jgi:hypothetical protein